ncbi:hypothetical protein [uncultured Methanobrevibacter sp.]|uniref:hypothetical protein n=1 Tax=uncultured Methanobrevibacter sp. TaxID=253161 RepID=UPI0025F3307C|nr:hypothetical protein [uncultured Methanobrevibacter sp.]
MDVFTKHSYGNLSDEEINAVNTAYQEIISLYKAGHSTLKIAIEYDMAPTQIQDIADLEIKEIQIDPTANLIYKMYGSYTLDGICNHLEISSATAKDIIHRIKLGKYGDSYKKVLLKRDMVSMNLKMDEYVIN